MIPNRWRAASAPFHYAHAARWTAQRAAAELRRWAVEIQNDQNATGCDSSRRSWRGGQDHNGRKACPAPESAFVDLDERFAATHGDISDLASMGATYVTQNIQNYLDVIATEARPQGTGSVVWLHDVRDRCTP